MPRQTPPNPPAATPRKAAKPVSGLAVKPAAVPLNRWAGMPAMSGFFRSGNPLLDLRDCFDWMFDSVFGGVPLPASRFGQAELPPRSGKLAAVRRIPIGHDAA